MFELNIFMFIHGAIMILSAICAFVFGFSTLFDFDNKDKLSLIVCYISFVIFIVSIIFDCVGMTKCEKSEWVIDEDPYAVEKIVSFNDNNLTNGRFYMRRGYIEENLYYQYIVKLNNGGFVANKVNSANAILFYTNDDYRVEWYTKTKKWLYWKMKETYNKIYIPEGSITDGYSVDLD